MKYLALPLLILIAFALYVRVAPSDPERWHLDPETAGAPEAGSFRTEVTLAAEPERALAAFQSIAMATPRTSLLAGDPDEGRLTFVTRSRIWGFPDYTTVSAEPAPEGARLVILARLRFGGGDLGVNRDRVEGWLERLEPIAR